MDQEILRRINGEGIMLDQEVLWFQGKLSAHPAQLIITRQSLLVWFKGSPMLGRWATVILKSMRPRLVLDAAITSVLSIEEEPYGLNKLIRIQTEGHSVRIKGPRLEDIRAVLKQILKEGS